MSTQQQPVDEENNDPFLELEPQTLFHHQHSNSHNTRRIDENDIDPSLHEDLDQRSSGSRTRLTDFASHILGSQDGDNHHDHDHEEVHGDHGELSFTGENGVLESSNHPFHAIDEEVDEGEFEPHLEEGHLDDGEEGEEGEGEFVGESQTPGPSHSVLSTQGQRVGRKRGAYGKRKRSGEDEVVIKKQNHVCPPLLPPSLVYPSVKVKSKETG